ncbi:DUF3382 domain-containing protein [Sodalis ligni]|uniref:DUF3382 domain-containing protein n=1 Tax=Sodalis ligni TaxID=2697027 RepID=UPI0030B81620
MSQPVTRGAIDFRQCAVDTVLAGLLALIIFGPMVGVALNGYSFDFQPRRLMWVILVVMAGRALVSLFCKPVRGCASKAVSMATAAGCMSCRRAIKAVCAGVCR